MCGIIHRAKRQVSQTFTASRNALRQTNAKLLWTLGVLSLVFVPAAVVGWQRDEGAAVSASSTEPAAEEVAPEALRPVQKIEKKDIKMNEPAPQKISVNVQTNSEPPKNGGQARVEVNGRAVPTPKSGTVHKIVSDANGTTTLDISTRSSSSGSDDSFSSTDVQLNSETHTESGSSP